MLRLAREHEVLITVEEGSVGGFGSYVLQHSRRARACSTTALQVRAMVLPDVYLDHDKPERMYASAGLDAEGIVAKVWRRWGTRQRPTSADWERCWPANPDRLEQSAT